MISIPAGSFNMGSPEDEPDRSSVEGPQHAVTIAPFFLGRYPITESQWNAVVKRPRKNLTITPKSNPKGNHPVTKVSWLEAVEFCELLTAHTGRPYRLPTEAEWEYACRAGTTTPFHYGDTISLELANYHPEGSLGYPKGSTPVGQYGVANAYGLSDMHGSVWEWCQDNWHRNYDGAPIDGSAWGDDAKDDHVMRGGSWNFNPAKCRSAARDINFIGYNPGFRVACSAPRT